MKNEQCILRGEISFKKTIYSLKPNPVIQTWNVHFKKKIRLYLLKDLYEWAKSSDKRLKKSLLNSNSDHFYRKWVKTRNVMFCMTKEANDEVRRII